MKWTECVLIAGGALVAILLAVNFLNSETPDRARIVSVQGQVAIQRESGQLLPAPGALLNPRDVIVTGPHSFVEIAYDDADKDIMRVGENSRVYFETNRIQKLTTLFMDRGQIKLKLDDLEKGSTFRVRTPVAIAGVRGTAFGLKLNGNSVLITDYESRIFVKGLTEDHLEMPDELLLSSGWQARVNQFEEPQQVEMITPGQVSEWKSWLAEIEALPKTDHRNLSFWNESLAYLGNVKMKVSSSPSMLALMLFGVLSLGTGKVMEKVWL